MQYFPLFLDLTDKPVLVVGGGEVASRKIEALLRANARVTVVSPAITAYLEGCVEKNRLTWIKSQYRDFSIGNYIQVWATTNDADLNHQVYKDAKKQNILVNVVDDKPYCDFITPSMVSRGKIQVAISSGGAAPVLVRNIREKIESALSHNIDLLADFAASKRENIKSYYVTVDERRYFWERYFARDDVQLANNKKELEKSYTEELNDNVVVTVSRNWLEYGSDVELISLKTLRAMQEAEVVLFPIDCPYEFIDLCRRDAQRQEYKDVQHLSEILNKESSSFKRLCIFMPKDEVSRNASLEKIVGLDRVLKVVG